MLVKIVFLCSGFITYVGPFNQEYRKDLQNRWLMDLTKKEIPISKDLNCVTFFADAPLISEWNLQVRSGQLREGQKKQPRGIRHWALGRWLSRNICFIIIVTHMCFHQFGVDINSADRCFAVLYSLLV